MPAVIISNNQMSFPFGTQTNQAIGRLIALNSTLMRLQDAISNASSGYEGTAGTQFETPPEEGQPANLFGVVQDPNNPGAQGAAYRYAMESIQAAWVQFWQAARDNIEALDNGQMSM